jgi:phospholipid transport system transporter-binding protein
MSDKFSVKVNPISSRVIVEGELSYNTANAVLEQSNPLFQSLDVLEIDLANVGRSDSAGVAVLVDWMRYAKQTNKDVVFHNIPAQILAIASASGLDEVLPVASSD